LKNTSQFYNRISFIYPLIDWFLKPQKELLAKEINGLKKGKLLEVGVGNGKHLNLFQKHEITGIDISEKMLKTAQSNQREKVNLLKMNAIEMTFPNSSFDYVILSHIVSVVENPTKLIAESCRVLKPNGKIFILNHFTPTNWLRFIDILFNPFSKLFHFKSEFYAKNLEIRKELELIEEIKIGSFGYYKLLVFEKK
jgi:phosphatidylethanolamine/phosphatidyl-N-methylethanolamine N-methyltransferase